VALPRVVTGVLVSLVGGLAIGLALAPPVRVRRVARGVANPTALAVVAGVAHADALAAPLVDGDAVAVARAGSLVVGAGSLVVGAAWNVDRDLVPRAASLVVGDLVAGAAWHVDRELVARAASAVRHDGHLELVVRG
jgi:hypothetical protein